MNISDIPYDIYKYYFNINAIEQAYKLQDEIKIQIKKCYLSHKDSKELMNYVKDFSEICDNILHRTSINTSELLVIAVKSLALINLKAQYLVYNNKYKHNYNIITLKKHYNNIDKYISVYKSEEKLFCKLIIINLLITLLCSIIICCFAINYNYLLYRLIFPLIILFLVVPILRHNKIKTKLKQASIIYYYRKNNYFDYKKLKKRKKLSRQVLSFFKSIV